MKDRQLSSTERVLKEYPYSTRWLEGQPVVGVGNLILTTKRLIFLHRVELADQQIENMRKMAEHEKADKIIDFALALHKKNFQITLASVVSARVGLYSLLPFPRPCLRISYAGAKTNQIKTASFMFTIPLLRGFFQFEIADVMIWVSKIRNAMTQAH